MIDTWLRVSIICDGRAFGYALRTKQLFTLNESILTDMLGLLRSSIPQTCDESSRSVAKGLLNELHPSFTKLFTVITTPAAGDCFYTAVSLTLFGNKKYMELIRLCTAFMLIRYRNVIIIIISFL